MHFRLEWYKNRWKLVAYMSTALVLAALATLGPNMSLEQGDWKVIRVATSEEADAVWRSGTRNLTLVEVWLLLLAATELGATALGEETGKQNLAFLLTRPRLRRYFVWSAWFSGLTQTLAIVLFSILSGAVLLGVLTSTLNASSVRGMALLLLTISAAAYGLAYLSSTATGNPRLGYQTVVAALFAYGCFRWFMALLASPGAWSLDAPPQLWQTFLGGAKPGTEVPWIAESISLGFALLSPLLSTWALDRREL